MNPIKFCIALLSLVCMTSGCKSAEKLLNKGQYDKAFYSAISQLKKNPDHGAASSLLPEAYHQYQALVLREMSGARGKEESLEQAYSGYIELQKMYEAISNTPGAQRVVRPVDYTDELNAAADNAAAHFYAQGDMLLALGDKRNAQKAYTSFSRADDYIRDYKDVQARIRAAEDLATTNVIINTIDQRFGFYNINGGFFENDLLWQLQNSAGRNSFYKFYNYNTGRNQSADQYIDIAMYDIWISPVYSNNYSYDVSKNITVPDETKPDETKTITVKATVTVKRSIIDSRAVMDCRITNVGDRRLLLTDRFGAQYSWENKTGTYQGDSRALSDTDWAIVRGAYNNPPSQDELYRELTKQLLNDFSNRMSQFYNERFD